MKVSRCKLQSPGKTCTPGKVPGHQFSGTDWTFCGGSTCWFMFFLSTEPKAENKDDDSESEEQARGADGGPAVASQPQRIALFPGVDPSALKVSQQLCFHLIYHVYELVLMQQLMHLIYSCRFNPNIVMLHRVFPNKLKITMSSKQHILLLVRPSWRRGVTLTIKLMDLLPLLLSHHALPSPHSSHEQRACCPHLAGKKTGKQHQIDVCSLFLFKQCAVHFVNAASCLL